MGQHILPFASFQLPNALYPYESIKQVTAAAQ